MWLGDRGLCTYKHTYIHTYTRTPVKIRHTMRARDTARSCVLRRVKSCRETVDMIDELLYRLYAIDTHTHTLTHIRATMTLSLSLRKSAFLRALSLSLSLSSLPLSPSEICMMAHWLFFPRFVPREKRWRVGFYSSGIMCVYRDL